MKNIKLDQLDQKEAALIQMGLKAAGFYTGTTRGIPGPKTKAAFEAYFKDDPARKRSLATKIVSLARQEIGVRESPKNSNRGKRVQEYQATTWLEGTGWAWCAAFICWLCKEAGMADDVRPKTAGAWDFERWSRKKTSPAELFKPASKTTIKAGDIVVFTFSHIGLAVDDQDGGYVKTVEGNTDASGSREGGGVYLKTRPINQIRSVIRLS